MIYDLVVSFARLKAAKDDASLRLRHGPPRARLVAVYYGLVAGNGQPDALACFPYRLFRTGSTAMTGDLLACRDTRQVGAWLDIERQSFGAIGFI